MAARRRERSLERVAPGGYHARVPAADLTTADFFDAPPSATPATALYLIVHAPGVAQVITLDDGDDVVAGRAGDAALRIECADVSRSHAVFRRRGPFVEVEDLGSRNGTWSDGQRIAGR